MGDGIETRTRSDPSRHSLQRTHLTDKLGIASWGRTQQHFRKAYQPDVSRSRGIIADPNGRGNAQTNKGIVLLQYLRAPTNKLIAVDHCGRLKFFAHRRKAEAIFEGQRIQLNRERLCLGYNVLKIQPGDPILIQGVLSKRTYEGPQLFHMGVGVVLVKVQELRLLYHRLDVVRYRYGGGVSIPLCQSRKEGAVDYLTYPGLDTLSRST